MAQYNLGLLCFNGKGVPQDYTEAAKWYRKAATQGLTQAQFQLGALYFEGMGVPQDYVQAHMWMNLSASKATGEDQKELANALDAVAKLMLPAQIYEAQRLAREWRPKK